MPNGIQSSNASMPPNLRLPELCMRTALGRLPLESIGNRPSHVPVCQMTNVSGAYTQRAFGCATEMALAVMAQSLGDEAQPGLSREDARAVQCSMSWLDPKQPQRFGNIVLGRITALAVMHAAVTDLLSADSSDPTLIKYESDLRKSIVNIAVASGKCERPPQGGSSGGASKVVAAHMKEAGECLAACATSLDTQALIGAVARAALPEALTVAIGDRLKEQVEKLKAEGHASLDVMDVLQGHAAEKIRGAVEHLVRTGDAESVQNGILTLLKIPQLVIEGQPGREAPQEPRKSVDPQPPAVPRELLDRAGGAPILYNNSPTTVKNNFSDLVKALDGGRLDLASINNLLDSAKRDAYALGRAEERVDRLLVVGEDQLKRIEIKDGRINELEQLLAEKNAELSKWVKGVGKVELGVARRDDGTLVDPASRTSPPVPLVTADMRRVSSLHSERIYDIPNAHTPVCPVIVQSQESDASEIAQEREVHSSIASNMSDTSELFQQSPYYVNTAWIRSRNSSGSSMGKGYLPSMDMLKEFEQVIEKKGPDQVYEHFSYPRATVLNAKDFKAKLQERVHSSDVDFEAGSNMQAVSPIPLESTSRLPRGSASHVNTTSIRFRTPSGSSMAQGELPVTSTIGELAQLLEQTRPDGPLAHLPLPGAAHVNARRFKAQQLGEVPAINVDIESVQRMQDASKSSWMRRVDSNGIPGTDSFLGGYEVVPEEGDNMVVFKAGLPSSNVNRQYPLGSDGESLIEGGSIQGSDDAGDTPVSIQVPTLLELINEKRAGLNRVNRIWSDSLGTGVMKFSESGW